MAVSVINVYVVCQILCLCLLGLQAKTEERFPRLQPKPDRYYPGFGKRLTIGYGKRSSPGWKHLPYPVVPDRKYEYQTSSLKTGKESIPGYDELINNPDLPFSDSLVDYENQRHSEDKVSDQTLKQLLLSAMQQKSQSYPSSQQYYSPLDEHDIIPLYTDDETYRKEKAIEQELELGQMLQNLLSDD